MLDLHYCAGQSEPDSSHARIQVMTATLNALGECNNQLRTGGGGGGGGGGRGLAVGVQFRPSNI